MSHRPCKPRNWFVVAGYIYGKECFESISYISGATTGKLCYWLYFYNESSAYLSLYFDALTDPCPCGTSATWMSPLGSATKKFYERYQKLPRFLAACRKRGELVRRTLEILNFAVAASHVSIF